jgi:hypothetical protein
MASMQEAKERKKGKENTKRNESFLSHGRGTLEEELNERTNQVTTYYERSVNSLMSL